MLLDVIVDQVITELLSLTHVSDDIRTEHGSDVLNSIRVEERTIMMFVQQILEARKSVEQAHESDLEGSNFVSFSDYRHDNASRVDLR